MLTQSSYQTINNKLDMYFSPPPCCALGKGLVLFSDMEHQTDDQADPGAPGGPAGEVWGRAQPSVDIPGGTGSGGGRSQSSALIS